MSFILCLFLKTIFQKYHITIPNILKIEFLGGRQSVM